MIVLSYLQARQMIVAREKGQTIASISTDLILSESEIKLQAEMKRLEEAEEDYLVQIEILKNEPLRVVSDMLNELHPSQIRTPRHDFMLFLAGIVVSAIVSILWNLLKIGG